MICILDEWTKILIKQAMITSDFSIKTFSSHVQTENQSNIKSERRGNNKISSRNKISKWNE